MAYAAHVLRLFFLTPIRGRSGQLGHLGLDLATGEIICGDLTLDDVVDPTALSGLLGQNDGPIIQFLADGAYDSTPASDLLKSALG